MLNVFYIVYVYTTLYGQDKAQIYDINIHKVSQIDRPGLIQGYMER